MEGKVKVLNLNKNKKQEQTKIDLEILGNSYNCNRNEEKAMKAR